MNGHGRLVLEAQSLPRLPPSFLCPVETLTRALRVHCSPVRFGFSCPFRFARTNGKTHLWAAQLLPTEELVTLSLCLSVSLALSLSLCLSLCVSLVGCSAPGAHRSRTTSFHVVLQGHIARETERERDRQSQRAREPELYRMEQHRRLDRRIIDPVFPLYISTGNCRALSVSFCLSVSLLTRANRRARAVYAVPLRLHNPLDHQRGVGRHEDRREDTAPTTRYVINM